VRWGLLLLLLLGPRIAAAECWVVQEGRPAAVIARPGPAAEDLAQSIAELQSLIQRISGARVELHRTPPAESGVVWLLTEADLPQHGSGITDTAELSALNSEGFLLRVGEGQAWLIGRTELGLQHAIYWLLEQWGCRWLFPGKAGEVVPSSPELVVTAEMQTAQQPRFLMRNLWYDYASWLPEDILADYQHWIRRNRMQYSFTGSIQHNYHNIVSFKDEELFRQHPDFFPIKLGRRVRAGQIVTEHPLVRQRAVDYAFDYFRRFPSQQMVSMSPNDGGGPWRSELTKRSRFTDAAVDLANHVARALRDNPETADKKVGMYAYFITALPPSVQVEDNVVIFVATKFTLVPWRILLKQWSRKARSLGIRGYASVVDWYKTRPTWRLGKLQRQVRYWDKAGIIGVSIESGNDWGGWGLYHYVLGRLLWNPDEEVERVVEDYIEKGFGQAAGDMKRYFHRWKCGYSIQVRDLATQDVQRALDKAADPVLHDRIRLFGLYLQHLRLLDDYFAARTAQERKVRLRELVGFAWRLAPTNMAHTIPLVNRYCVKWAARDGITREQIEAWK
jgi:hypothetical protein